MMRRISMLLFTVGLLAAVDATAQSPRSSKPQDEQQIRNIEAKCGQFEQANDLSIVGLLADNWVGSSNGRVMARADLEKGVKNNLIAHGNGPNPYTIEKKNLAVYVFGDTAVATYTKEYRQTADIAQIHDEDVTDAFVRSPKGWLWQFSKISPVLARSPTD